MGLFERKIKGKNMVYAIRIKNPVPYPEEEIRWDTYGAPLSSFFGPYFEKVGVAYYQDKENKLDQINVVCYDATFSYKKSREDEIFANLYRMFSHHVESFFGSMGIDAEIVNIGVPSQTEFEEFFVDSVKWEFENDAKHDKDEILEGKGKPTILTSPETNQDDLITPLGYKVDFEDIKQETMTIQKSEDGRYFVGGISKKDGKKYYFEIPEELAKSIINK
jgi:hypothetical protein